MLTVHNIKNSCVVEWWVEENLLKISVAIGNQKTLLRHYIIGIVLYMWLIECTFFFLVCPKICLLIGAFMILNFSIKRDKCIVTGQVIS